VKTFLIGTFKTQSRGFSAASWTAAKILGCIDAYFCTPLLPSNFAAQDRDPRLANSDEILHDRSLPAIFLVIGCS